MEQASIDLRSYATALRRHVGIVAVCAAIGLGLGAAHAFLTTPTYSATSRVLVSPVTNNPFDQSRPDLSVQLDTEKQVVASTAVADLAAARMPDAGTAGSLLHRLSVTALTDTRVLAISFSDASPRLARAGAVAFAQAYLEYSRDRAEAMRDRLEGSIQAQIDDVRAQISELNQVLSTVKPGTPEAKDANDALAALRTREQTLQTQFASLSTLDTTAGELISRPQVPTAPAKPNKKVDLLAGLVLGLLAGSGIALYRERRSDRMEDHHDLEAVLGYPALAVVPTDREWKNPLRAELAIREHPQSPAAEAYRALRTSLLAAADREGIKTVLVTSANAGEGKSTTAANLAVALVEAGRKVVLISADLRRPRIHSFFVLPNTRGLADVLAGTVQPENAVYFPLPSLMVMPSGPPPTHPADLLQSDTMFGLMTERPGRTDFIIVDSPPILPVADGLSLASAVDAVIVVADARTTTASALVEAKTRVERVGGRILGAVWNNAEAPAGYRGYDPDPDASPKHPSLRPVLDDPVVKHLPSPDWARDRDAVRAASYLP